VFSDPNDNNTRYVPDAGLDPKGYEQREGLQDNDYTGNNQREGLSDDGYAANIYRKGQAGQDNTGITGRARVRFPTPVLTYGILAINFVLWMLMTISGGSTDSDVLIRFGAMSGPLIIKGQYWRFITPLFLHVGIIHLGFNSYALYQLGTVIETIYGRAKYVALFMLSGISGSIMSFMFTRAVSAGASGAIFGLLGSLLYYGRKRPGLFKKGFTANIISIIAINLVIGLTYPGIDNYAHIGGLIGGYAVSVILGAYRKMPERKRYAYLATFVMLLVLVAAIGIRANREDDRVLYHEARQLVEEGSYRRAELILEDIIDRLPEGEDIAIEARYLYSYNKAMQGDIDTAIEHALIVARYHPESFNVNLLLGIMYANKGDRATAREYLERAQRIEPGNQQVRDILEQL
jgi:rhomboid protease GluP